MLEIGNIAPLFCARIDENNKEYNLKDYIGSWIILYFYPKDHTSGCTKEACNFRDNMARIANYNALVFGISPDSILSHNKFKDKLNLNFTLIPDPNKEICSQYGVLGTKQMFGKSYIGVIRTTFLINPEGKIVNIWRKVKVDGHVDDVIAKLEECKNND